MEAFTDQRRGGEKIRTPKLEVRNKLEAQNAKHLPPLDTAMRAEDNTLPLTRWAMKNVENISLRAADGGVVIAVKVVPGSSRDKVAGVLGDCLKITTSAAAEKGRANAAVAKTLAKALGVSARDVELASGKTSPRKEFHVAGLTADVCRLRLAGL